MYNDAIVEDQDKEDEKKRPGVVDIRIKTLDLLIKDI